MGEIHEILGHYRPDCQPAQIEPLGSAGGMSGAQFWRIPVVRGSPDPTQTQLVLRRWPVEHPSPERLRFIHAVLAYAARRGIAFIPLPIHTINGETFVESAGHLWELAPWLPGVADYEHNPRPEKLRAAMTALAKFHNAVTDFKPAGDLRVAGNAVQRHLTRLQQLATGGAQELTRAITDTTWPDLAPCARQFLAALPSAVPRAIAQLEPLASAQLPTQPCIRDIWHDHILFTGDEVTGIIDFGAVDIDTPATDVARLLSSLVGDDAANWQTGLAAYSKTRPLSQNERIAISALDTSGTILAGCNWVRWIYVDGRAFDNREQVIARFRKVVAHLVPAVAIHFQP